MSNVAVGTEYEKIVQSIYKTIMQSEGVDNIDVRHNIKLQGNSGCNHQIDVYWEYKIAGHVYKTAIECKAFNKEVNVGRIRDFYGVLVDVPGLNGIFTTMIGYQSGARKYAKHYGIALQEVREPTGSDWVGRVKNIGIKFHVLDLEVTSWQPKPTQAFLKTIGEGERIEHGLGFQTDQAIVFDNKSGAGLSRIDLDNMLPFDFCGGTGLEYFVPLPNHILKIDGFEIPIEGIKYIYNVRFDTEELLIKGAEIAKAIVRDVVSGDITFLDNKGNVRQPSRNKT